MTNEEALNWFKDDLKNGKCSDECPQCNAMERAIEALEKQVAKKPITTEEQNIRYGMTYTCPSCGKHFTGTGIADYCYHCGQALDWSDTDA